jgi:putative two-component system response regulator
MAHNIALSHHEKFDGSGYPRGLSGEEIPLEGRIVAVADVFDAVMSKRCYKEAFDLDQSLEILTSGAGKHFDPLVVEAFMGVKDRILQIREHYTVLEQQAEAEGHDIAAAFLRKPGSLVGRTTLT